MVLQRQSGSLRRFVAKRAVFPLALPTTIKVALEEANKLIERNIEKLERGERKPEPKRGIAFRSTEAAADIATLGLGAFVNLAADVADIATPFDEDSAFESFADIPVDLFKDIARLTKRSVELSRKKRALEERLRAKRRKK